jgi:hypothetical protein
MNTIYVDCNRANALIKSDDTNNEYTYKLNTELLLPRGTTIQCQNSFVNQKGITGGSLEIENDIIEEISFFYYTTENYNPTPISHKDAGGTWFRGGLNIAYSSFKHGLEMDATTYPDNWINDAEAVKLSQDNDMPDESVPNLEKVHYDYFKATGGSSMILPECEFVNQYVRPKIRTHKIKIPKGIYGISQLGQLIEDQINGIKYFDEASGDVINVDSNRRDINDLNYDGQPKNAPALVYSKLQARKFNIIQTIPTDFFVNMFDFNKLMEDWKTVDNFEAGFNANYYHWNSWKNSRQAYVRVNNFDNNNASFPDPDTPYHIGSYPPFHGGTELNQRLIGTNNFKFQYDLTKNGYVIEGLHNQVRCPSHDRQGGQLTNAGLPIIYFKKVASQYRTDFNTGVNTYNYGENAWNTILSCINTPQTRDGGIMIVNWGKSTAEKLGDKTPERHPEAYRFGEFFGSEIDAKKAWKKTIWGRLGFEYDQIQNHNKFDKTQIWNKYADVPEYGFTTNTTIDPSIVPTISGTNNPIVYGGDDGDRTPKVEAVQLHNNDNIAFTNVGIDHTNANMYANSLLTHTCMYPVVVSDVGGITAQNLPTLTTNSYYLITSDILDNFKDNVKKGDVLPLLAVVPKSSLSNEDFIVAENQIVQVLSQEKVINKIKIKILNPDLTAPQLEENSSVILKITLPNITPSTLLPPKVQQQLSEASITY